MARTGIFGLRDDLGEELEEVREVAAKEVCLDDKSLACVLCRQLAAEELGFADDAECGTFCRVLRVARGVISSSPNIAPKFGIEHQP